MWTLYSLSVAHEVFTSVVKVVEWFVCISEVNVSNAMHQIKTSKFASQILSMVFTRYTSKRIVLRFTFIPFYPY